MMGRANSPFKAGGHLEQLEKWKKKTGLQVKQPLKLIALIQSTNRDLELCHHHSQAGRN